jgi:hypothetical protein
MADDDGGIEIVSRRAVDFRLTRTLYRLTPFSDSGSKGLGRPVVVVAADTEEEARHLASMHDPFRRDWKDRKFAAAQLQHSDEDHLFGDVTLRSEPWPSERLNS